MAKMMFTIFLFFICNSIAILSVDMDELIFRYEIQEKYNLPILEPQEKYNLSICAIFKNETPNLKEWIEYHRLFGVDHFYLYNIGGTDSFQEILEPYVQRGIVTLINWPEVLSDQEEDYVYRWALCTQIPAYENAVNFTARNETKWLMFADIDEFLVCPKGNSIRDLLQKYDEHPGISLTSDIFDAGIYDGLQNKSLLIQTVNVTRAPPSIVTKSISKMIFKPRLSQGFMWPPYQRRFINSQQSIAVDRKELRINRYLNRNFKQSPIPKIKHKLDFDHHLLSDSEISALLDEGYLIEDPERAIFQYVPALLKKLGKEVEKRN